MRLLTIVFVVLAFPGALPAADPDLSKLPAPADRRIDFVKDIQPLFAARCLTCHGPEKQKSNYRLDSKPHALKGGDFGNRPIVLGDSAHSPLVQYVAGVHPEITMPPKGEHLTTEQVGVLRAWIDQGAAWPADADKIKVADKSDWWSLRPIIKSALPAGISVANPIDAFVLAKLREKNLVPNPPADRRTLIRRVTFDLIGLPPSPQEVESFVNDPDERAYDRLVDRLLASPRYGERWARHWLDAAHYGDTHGYDKDKVREHAWPYRDYVIRALNDDKPYDRFVREQLAGDHFYPGTADGVVALGFLAAGPWDFVGQVELREATLDKTITRNLDRDDMVTVAVNTFASLTAQCARCHNHKFDPITQEDYYALQAVFAAVDRADRPYEPDEAVARQRRELQTKLAALTKAKSANDPTIAQTSAALKALPSPAVVYAAATDFPPAGSFTPTHGKPRPIHLLHRGSEKDPRQEVGPGTLALAGLPSRFKLSADAPESARRAALADWLLDPRNPLTWRSIVNRVWQYHFGRGIVETPNDFGHMGALPTHPELLDYLAADFRDGDRSLKKLHRLIVTSETYRRSAAHNSDNAKIDSANQYLWRANRARLDAETIRDSVLAVSGQLDLAHTGGPGFRAFGFKDDHSPHYTYSDYDPDDPATHRRSVYRFIVRSAPDPFMETLDCADPSQIVPKRNETLTPLQALALLNNRFMIRMSEQFAARLAKGSPDPTEQIDQACRLAYGRPATHLERQTLLDIAQRHGLASACRLILNSNEFIFVD